MPPIEIQDTDLLLINRGDTTYKVTALDLELTGPQPINPGADDITFDPGVSGTGTEFDPFILSSGPVEYGNSTFSDQEITISNQKAGNLVVFSDLNSDRNGDRFNQSVGTVPEGSNYKTKLRFLDVPATDQVKTYSATIRIGSSSIYLRWDVNVIEPIVAPVLNSVSLVATNTDETKRFEDQTFTTVLDVTEGNPLSTKSVGYKVAGTLAITPKTSEIVGESTVTVPGGWIGATTPQENSWGAVTYGNGYYVAVAYSGTNRVMRSTDAINWTLSSEQASTSSSWNSIVYGGDKFVAIANAGTFRVMYSTNDGSSWNGAASGVQEYAWNAVTYGDGKFIAVCDIASGNQVMYSGDGLSWIGTAAAENNDWHGIAYGAGRYVAVASNGTNRAMYTAGSVNNWVAVPVEACSWSSITYGGGKFVAVARSGNNRVMYSTDGISWTPVAVEALQWYSVTYGNGRFVAVASYDTGDRVMWSDDGITWTRSSSFNNNNNWYSVTYGNGKFVSVSNNGTKQAMWSESGIDEYSTTTLTLADNTGLSDFTAGMLVKQNSAITGTAPAFSTTLFNGTNADLTIDTGIDNTGSGGLVWMKSRDNAWTHNLYDTKRGRSYLQSNDVSPAGNSPAGKGLTSFNSNGFSLGTNFNNENINNGGYVAWNFRAAPKFFDIQTYVGDNTFTQQISHNLQSEPKFILIKSLDLTQNWAVYHNDGTTKRTTLSLNNAAGSGGTSLGGMTNTYFTPGEIRDHTVASPTNASDYVAYLFADTPGLIKCGGYTGGPSKQIDCGFKPQWVMIKRSNSSSDWSMLDHYRYQDPAGGKFNRVLKAQESEAERTDLTNDRWILPNTNGFQLSSSDWADTNSSSGEYIFIAIAENAMADVSVTPAGLFQSADPAGPTMTLTPQVAGWQANQGKRALGPRTVLDDATLYLEINSLRQVTDTSESPVYYETTAATDTITFDQPTGTGITWDDEFPNGTTIQSYAYADNTAAGGGRSPESGTIYSNVIQPEAAFTISDYFATTLYTGAALTQTVTTGIDNTDKSLVWVKSRTNAFDHILRDTVADLALQSNEAVQGDSSSAKIQAFLSGGFETGNSGQTNNTGDSLVAWNFKATPKFFDVQTFTGNAAVRQISHDLTSTPGMIIVKCATAVQGWRIYHKSLGATKSVFFSDQKEYISDSSWNDTEPTSSVFTVGIDDDVNKANETMVAYLFADEPGLIKCGSFSSTGFVETGFKPQWVLFKSIDKAGDWQIFDSKRDGTTGEPAHKAMLIPNKSNSEVSGYTLEFNDTGFTQQVTAENTLYVAIAAPVVRSLTQEEVDTAKLLFETKEFRKIKHEQDLVARATELRAGFEARGFTTAEIDKVLGSE